MESFISYFSMLVMHMEAKMSVFLFVCFFDGQIILRLSQSYNPSLPFSSFFSCRVEMTTITVSSLLGHIATSFHSFMSLVPQTHELSWLLSSSSSMSTSWLENSCRDEFISSSRSSPSRKLLMSCTVMPIRWSVTRSWAKL